MGRTQDHWGLFTNDSVQYCPLFFTVSSLVLQFTVIRLSADLNIEINLFVYGACISMIQSKYSKVRHSRCQVISFIWYTVRSGSHHLPPMGHMYV